MNLIRIVRVVRVVRIVGVVYPVKSDVRRYFTGVRVVSCEAAVVTKFTFKKMIRL